MPYKFENLPTALLSKTASSKVINNGMDSGMTRRSRVTILISLPVQRQKYPCHVVTSGDNQYLCAGVFFCEY